MNGLAVAWKAPDSVRIARRLLPFVKSSILLRLSQRRNLHPAYRLLYSLLNDTRISNCEQEICREGQSPIRPDMYYDERAMNGLAMSTRTVKMLGAYQPDEVRAARRKNYALLREMLPASALCIILFSDLADGVCPLNLPILVGKRDRMQVEMYKRGVDAGAFWKGYHAAFPLHDFPEAKYLKDHVVALPIHQDLDSRQIRYIADTLKHVLKVS